jgi:hypothetical protein
MIAITSTVASRYCVPTCLVFVRSRHLSRQQASRPFRTHLVILLQVASGSAAVPKPRIDDCSRIKRAHGCVIARSNEAKALGIEMGAPWHLHREAAQDAALARMELTDLWGIASRLAARLLALGIATPLDLKRGDARLIRERLGVVTMRLALELRGVRCLDLEREISDRKSDRHGGVVAMEAFAGEHVTADQLDERRQARGAAPTQSASVDTMPSRANDWLCRFSG